ncbi:hypothetical protein M0R04_15180 [Candidatus Dojkabacteria bacterium]|jgi:hypothetical protein|nr:hypothetical protein [Candidatus Dojkabacteria bacterium]
MKASEAMRFIAAAYYKPWEERSVKERSMTTRGLCHALSVIGKEHSVDLRDIYQEIYKETNGNYWLPIRDWRRRGGQFRKDFTQEYDLIRGDFCNLLAEQFEGEGL